MREDCDRPFPPYAFVPGGPWPHPTSHPQGHSWGRPHVPVPPIEGDDWRGLARVSRGDRAVQRRLLLGSPRSLGRPLARPRPRGPTADVLKGLIKLAAAGVKVRQGQPHGIVTHARRAAALFESARAEGGDRRLGLDLGD